MANRLSLLGRYLARATTFQNSLYFGIEASLLKHLEWGQSELDIYQRQQLVKTLTAAVAKLPAYRGTPGPITVENAKKVLASLPVTTKPLLLERSHDFYPYDGRPRPWLTVGRTSGTTGSPAAFFRSLNSVLHEEAFIRRYWRSVGFERGNPRCVIRGDLVVPVESVEPPFWYHNSFDNQLLVSSRHLSSGYIGPIIDEIRKFQPRMLQAYPSTAYALAKFLDVRNEYLDIPVVMTSSEPLYPLQRSLIEDRLHGRVWDMYGMAERVAMATECRDGFLHINSDYSYVEIVDEHGHETEDMGSIVGTTFHNHAMPLVRYQLSDQARWLRGSCSCGSPFPRIEPIFGKLEDQLSNAKGDFISPSVVTFAFKGLQNILQSQVVQESPGNWKIRIIPGPNYQSEDDVRIIDNIRRFVDATINVQVVACDEIPRTKAGKFRWVVNNGA